VAASSTPPPLNLDVRRPVVAAVPSDGICVRSSRQRRASASNDLAVRSALPRGQERTFPVRWRRGGRRVPSRFPRRRGRSERCYAANPARDRMVGGPV